MPQVHFRASTLLGGQQKGHLSYRAPAPIIISLPVRCKVLRSACLSVCLSARLKNHTFKLQIVCTHNYLWPWLGPPLMAMQLYVLPVLWMTSFFHTMEQMGQNRRRCIRFVHFANWRYGGRSLLSRTASCTQIKARWAKDECEIKASLSTSHYFMWHCNHLKYDIQHAFFNCQLSNKEDARGPIYIENLTINLGRTYDKVWLRKILR